MSDSRTAILITLDDTHEGGFQANPHDKGNWTGGQVGVGTLVGTNGGITAMDMPGADIKNLTIEQKVEYYMAHYWKPFYSQIFDQHVANKLFDMGVLFGIGTAVKKLQIAANANVDGNFGAGTLALVNRANPTELLAAFKDKMVHHATWAAQTNPNEAEDLAGWIRRINS